MTRTRKVKTIVLALATVGTVLGAAGCTHTAKNYATQEQKVTQTYAATLDHAEPYPLSQMNDSAERANLREKLLRLNAPGKIGYVYELSNNGAVVAEYQIRGKVSSTDSQLTTQDQYSRICSQGNCDMEHFNSMGDDGSYGPNEPGIFFFTTTGVLVEWNGTYQYSDAPLHLSTPPLLTINENAKPSSTAGQLK